MKPPSHATYHKLYVPEVWFHRGYIYCGGGINILHTDTSSHSLSVVVLGQG